MDIRKELAEAVAQCVGLDAKDVEPLIEVPQQSELGDLALPCFKLAKTMRKAPPAIAAQIFESCRLPQLVSRAEVVGGYLNFFLDRQACAKTIVEAAIAAGEAWGSGDEGAGKTVVIDYSSINIAKPFHIGHLSTTAIGNALYRIYGFLGYECVGVNHLGDWGTQFGKLIVAFKRWGDKDTIEAGGVRAMLEIYVRFHDEAEKDPSLDDEARAWFKRIEDGDPEALSLFQWFKDITLKEVGRVYDMLGVSFDSYAGESFYNDKMEPVIEEIREKGLLVESDGAYVVRLDEFDLPPCIILKSDGATLYSTRDLAAAFYRKKTYDFSKCLYVVAYQQNLHFKQFFKVLELMGCDWAADMEHIAFGMVSLEGGSTLSTRKGKVVFLEEVLEAACEKTLAIIDEKNPDLPDKETVARQVGVGAILFGTLYSSRIKDITFSLERALNFDGETGPYAQYTHARACSVLRKAGAEAEAVTPDWSALDDPEAFAVVKLIETFGESVRTACAKNEPYLVTRHVTALAQAFNKYYFDVRIVTDDPAQTAARLALTRAVKNTVKTGLSLIGVEAPERM